PVERVRFVFKLPLKVVVLACDRWKASQSLIKLTACLRHLLIADFQNLNLVSCGDELVNQVNAD
ncbi:hypothetical protein D7Y13_44875, partial [Corallococcus praedator]